MNITISPGKLQGDMTAIPSKSHAHRALICAAFSDDLTTIICPETNKDIEATVDCLRALGARIDRTDNGYTVRPIQEMPSVAELNCNESGSTLRFMLPVAGALGVNATFHLSGRLPERPLSPLWEEMERMGCRLVRGKDGTVHCGGRLIPGEYKIAGNVSSQFISGLLFALPLLDGISRLHIVGRVESRPYIELTKSVLREFGVDPNLNAIRGCFPFRSPGTVFVEGDWSNAAFFYVANKIGSNVQINGLNQNSTQGDRAVVSILDTLDISNSIDARDIPDLVPVLSVAAAAKTGATFKNISRLRAKESDRVQSVIAMLRSLGVKAESTENTLTIFPGQFHGGTVDSANDHRIAMSAAIAATIAEGPVTIIGAQCVEKSYPAFWDEYRRLGGNYEQYIR